MWNNAINSYPDSYIPLAYFKRGSVYTEEQDNRQALSDFNKALMLYYKKLGVSADYKPEYDRLRDSHDGYPGVYDFLAVKFSEINRSRGAINLFNILLKLNPSDIGTLFNLSSLYGNLGEYKDAIRVGKKIIELAPNFAPAHYNLSIAYYFDKQNNLALKHLKSTAELGYKIPNKLLDLIKKPKNDPNCS